MTEEICSVPQVTAKPLTPDEKKVCERVDLGNATTEIEKLREKIGGNAPMSIGAEVRMHDDVYKNYIFTKYVDSRNSEIGQVLFCPSQKPWVTGVEANNKYCKAFGNTDKFACCSFLDSSGRVSSIEYEDGTSRSFDTYLQD